MANPASGSNQPTSGNAAAESSAPPPFTPPPPSENPGSMDELHKKCKDLFPLCFDGLKIMFPRELNRHFQVTHTLNMSPTLTGYRFGATYVGMKQFSPAEAYPIMLADTDLSGNISATVIHQFSEKIRCKFLSQIAQNKISAVQLTSEYRGRYSTSSLTLANPDILSGSGVLVASYLRKITPRLDLGVEIVQQFTKQMPGGVSSALSYSARYSGRDFVASGSYGANSMHMCYYHKGLNNFQYGVEWETNFRLQESVAAFAYQAELPTSVFRASIDTNWTVGAVLEKKLSPALPFTLALSGMVNFVKNQSRVGIGLILG